MSVKLKRNEEEEAIEIIIDGVTVAGWASKQCKFSDKQLRIVARMIDIGVAKGKELRSEEIKKLLGAS